MIYLILKSVNASTRIGVSNLKDEIDKATLANFGNNLKNLLDDMYLNYSIILDKGELHEDYVRHIFRDLFSRPNSTFNSFVERSKYDWYTETEVL